MQSRKNSFTLARMNMLWKYKNGKLVWNINRANGIRIGDTVGCLHRTGYIVTTFEKKQYLVHRLIYQITNGVVLSRGDVVDHIDGDKLNNHKSNLRRCTQAQNNMNRTANTNSQTGEKCICPIFKDGRWWYTLTITRKSFRLQRRFPKTKAGMERAIKIRNKTLRKLDGSFARW